MKRLVKAILICLIFALILPSCTLANSNKMELSSKKYVKILKKHINKDKFYKIDRFSEMNLLLHIKANKKGVQLVYIEPTIEKIEFNQNKIKILISFINNNSTEDKKINNLSKEMLNYLNEMNECLNNAHEIYTSQLGFDISDKTKLENLGQVDYYLKDENITYAYDYINVFNDRIEKINKVYFHIKDCL